MKDSNKIWILAFLVISLTIQIILGYFDKDIVTRLVLLIWTYSLAVIMGWVLKNEM